MGISASKSKKSKNQISNKILNKIIELSHNAFTSKDIINLIRNTHPEISEKLSKFYYLNNIIENLHNSGGKELVEKFLNFDLERLKRLSKFNRLYKIIYNLNECGEKELVEKFLNFDLERIEKLIEFHPLCERIKNLNNSGGNELVQKFLNLDIKSLKFLSYLYKKTYFEINVMNLMNLFITIINHNYHEFFNLLLSCDIKNKEEILSNFLINFCNFNSKDKIDPLFEFIKRNKDNPKNINISLAILANIKFFEDDKISDIKTIENLDNIIKELTEDNFKTFFNKDKIQKYIEQKPIFELIQNIITENKKIDNLINDCINEYSKGLFDGEKFENNNIAIFNPSLENLIKFSRILEEVLNISIVEFSSSFILEILSKNNKNQDLINFISKTVNLCSEYIKEKISEALCKYNDFKKAVEQYQGNKKEYEIKEISRYFIKQILQTIIIFSFSDKNKDVIIYETKIKKNNKTRAQISNEEEKSEEGKNIKDSFKINEFLEEIFRPIFKEVGINSVEDLFNFICEIDYLNQDSNKEYKVKFLDNKAFIISYLGNIVNPSEQQTNMNVDNIQIAQVKNTKHFLLNKLTFNRYS